MTQGDRTSGPPRRAATAAAQPAHRGARNGAAAVSAVVASAGGALPELDGAALARCAEVEPKLSGHSAESLRPAYAHCRAVARKAARNFYHGLKLIPEPRRSAIYSIYAWMRAADDRVDDAGDAGAKASRLAYHVEVTENILRGGTPDAMQEPYWLAFAATLASFPVPRQTIRDMLAGLDEDLRHEGYETDAELDRYCYRVAGTVGLVCVSIWGLVRAEDAMRAAELAVRRGLAFQLTNILRDFRQDYDDAERRIYLSRESLRRHGLTLEALREWKDQARCWKFVSEQAARARREYEASAELEKLISADCVPALHAMTRIYSELLEVIEKDPQRIVGEKRIRVAGRRKALIALTARRAARKVLA